MICDVEQSVVHMALCTRKATCFPWGAAKKLVVLPDAAMANLNRHANQLLEANQHDVIVAGRSNDRPSAALQPSSIPRQSSTDASEDLEVMGRSHSEASGFSRDAAKFPKLNFKGALLKGPR